jgi:hypothetical protein
LKDSSLIFNPARHRLTIIILCSLLLTACATAPNHQALQKSKEIFKSGDVRGALLSHEESYESQKLKDTPYYLDKGTIVKYLGSASLSESSLNLLQADAAVQKWEEQTKINLARNSADFLNYFFAPVRSGAPYEPKDFEKSMLAYQLAVNHILAGKWDFAAIEARKMAEREKLIEALREKQLEAVNRKERENVAGRSRSFSRVENINGYPVDVIDSPEVNALKNAYQNAAAHYLAGFIFESRGDISLAAPGYRLAVELRPGVKLFRDSLNNLDQNASGGESNLSDTLIIVETGSIPTIYSHKSAHLFPTRRGSRLVTFTIPAIEARRDMFEPALARVGETQIPLYNASNLDAMVRRQLKDAMPGYILKASMQAIVQVIAQEATQTAMEKNKDQQGYAALAALLVGAAMSVGDADVRAWTSLPSGIYMGRAVLPKGESAITIPSPAGYITVPIRLSQRYEMIHVRILRNQVIVTTQPADGPITDYMNPAAKTEQAAAPTLPQKIGAVVTAVQEAGKEKKSGMMAELNCTKTKGFAALNKFFNKTDAQTTDEEGASNCKK